MSSDPSNTSSSAPYARDRAVDKPGIIGARWWHASLVDQEAQIARRTAIRNILIAGGVIAGFGAMLAMCVKAGSSPSGLLGGAPDVSDARKTALEMQKEYGWSFGAVGEALVFDGYATKPFEPGALRSLATDLAPASPRLVPFFQATLFQSPDAVPPSLGKLDPSEVAGFQPLSAVMKPMFSTSMDAAYARGKSLASLFASLAEVPGQTPASAKTALIVDLAGPESVAFAAGAIAMFDPVFLFDNWPHPRGIVRAQETLAAAAYYQPLFAEAKKANRPGRSPMFVLDRRRIATYTDDATEFDNRYVAKLPPSAAAMRALDVTHILYVVPSQRDAFKELDDLNDELVVYSNGGADVKALSLDMFATDKTDAGVSTPPTAQKESDKLLGESGFVYYGGSRGSHHAFFADYPWARPARAATTRPGTNTGKSYFPSARVTPYSSGSPSGVLTSKPRPTSFGTVPVAIAVGTGVILGARYSRSGSWNRSSGGFGG
ncbi:MAG: hypothetical protein JWP87_883 [Labilithrix sp.]|nr:hypothetical protein [Labilithrix sp.]